MWFIAEISPNRWFTIKPDSQSHLSEQLRLRLLLSANGNLSRHWTGSYRLRHIFPFKILMGYIRKPGFLRDTSLLKLSNAKEPLATLGHFFSFWNQGSSSGPGTRFIDWAGHTDIAYCSSWALEGKGVCRVWSIGLVFNVWGLHFRDRTNSFPVEEMSRRELLKSLC